jgi:hypothetical protein
MNVMNAALEWLKKSPSKKFSKPVENSPLSKIAFSRKDQISKVKTRQNYWNDALTSLETKSLNYYDMRIVHIINNELVDLEENEVPKITEMRNKIAELNQKFEYEKYCRLIDITHGFTAALLDKYYMLSLTQTLNPSQILTIEKIDKKIEEDLQRGILDKIPRTIIHKLKILRRFKSRQAIIA